jgi:hypothetical protein
VSRIAGRPRRGLLGSPRTWAGIGAAAALLASGPIAATAAVASVPGSGVAAVTPAAAGTSQNGWPANSDPSVIDVHSFLVPGTARHLTIRGGDVAAILLGVASRFNSRVETLGASIGGYNYRVIAGSSVLSNHASGTAIDLNYDKHPQGVHGTFTAAQVSAIRGILAICGSVVRWGGDYTTTVDEMHFEINVPPGSASLHSCATKMGGGGSPVIDLFGTSPTSVLYRADNAAGSWSAWSPQATSGSIASAPAAVSLAVGKVEVFAASRAGAVYRAEFSPLGGWSSWASLGGATSFGPSAVTVGGHVDVFVTGTNGQLYEASNSSGAWSGLTPAGGAGTIASGPSAIAFASGEVDVFGRASNSAVYLTRYVPVTGWTGWSKVGGATAFGPGAVAVGGHADVFVTGTSGQLYQSDNQAGRWSAFSLVVGTGTIASAPRALAFASGAVDVFGTASNKAVYQASYVPGTGWSGWAARGGALSGPPDPVTF